MWWRIILTSLFLGVGLAMDACAVSMTNGMNEPKMKAGRATLIAFMYAFFQALMPMIGWTCVTLVVDKFTVFTKYVPYIAFTLLAIIGGKMLYDGIKAVRKQKRNAETSAETQDTNETTKRLTFVALLLQALATSIDALSTGFSLSEIAGNNAWIALLCSGIIAAVTFALSLGAVFLGKKFGNKLGSKAEIVGGCVLIAIGLEILISGIFF